MLIPVHYGRFLTEDLSAADPMYALSELFQFAAASELQFLNMVDFVLNSETTATLAPQLEIDVDVHLPSSALSNFLYHKAILRGHVRTLKENVRFLRPEEVEKWAVLRDEKLNEKMKERARESMVTLFRAFEDLELAEKLSEACDRGMDTAANNAMVAESKQMMEQAKYVSNLTLLAFLFIPAAFTTLIFGINVKELNSGSESIWIWVVVLIGTFIASMTMMCFDMQHIFSKLQRSALSLVR